VTPVGRTLRPIELFTLAFGTIAGIAWLFLTGPWLRVAGPLGATLGLMAGAILMIPIVWCYARASELYPGGGGELLYVGHTLGRWLGLLAGWLLALAYIALVAFHVVTVSWLAEICLARSAEMGATPAPSAAFGSLVSLGIFAVIVYGNLKGAASASRLQDVIVIALALATLGLAANAMRFGQAHYLSPYFGSSSSVSSGILQVVATAPFLYGGFNTAIQAAHEVNPHRSARVMLTLGSAILAAAVFYSAILLSIACVLPREQLLNYDMPALDAFQSSIRSPLATLIVSLVALVALCTSWNGVLLGAWKLVAALCQVRLFPGMASSHERFRFRFAVALVVVVSLLLSLRGRLGLLGIVAVVALIIALVFCMMSVGILRALVTRSVPRRLGGKGPLGIACLAVAISMGSVALSIANLLHTPTSRSDVLLLGSGAVLFALLAIGRRRQILDLAVLKGPAGISRV
jgi:amino acid transporter